jgi:hypothetical protein
VILEKEPLLIPIISSGSQQWLICSGSETATDASFEPLQMTFSVVVAVNEAEVAHEALQVAHASEQLARVELDSLRSKATRACDSMLDISSSGSSLTSHLGEIPSQVERAVADRAYFGAQTVLSVVTSH